MKNALCTFIFLFSCTANAAGSTAEATSGSYVLDGGARKELVVYFHKPNNCTAQSPVLIVVPGAGRNAWSYRDAWIRASERHGVLILSPHYSERHYPRFWDYNLGGMLADVTINEARTGFGSFNIVKKPSDWIFQDFDRMFVDATRRFGLNVQEYDMFGHSAGGQILHRLALFHPGSRANRLLAANSGWYTVPRFDVAFPYGLKNSGLTPSALRVSFKEKLLVFLGELDNEEETRGHLARNEELDVQGSGRLARGRYFFDQAESTARRLAADSNWRLIVVPGVGHDYVRMSEAAAEYLYDD